MTHAVAAPARSEPAASQTVPIVILGTDSLLAAAPATPVQLAHACLRAGFGNVVPASWGDELIAAAVLRQLPRFGNGPAIQCSCPIVAHRLLTTGGDLRPVMLALVSPPVALARYVRALSHPTRTRITYVGGCPGASDESIDIRMTPEALIAMLAERDIAAGEAITFNYNTTEYELAEPFRCHCDSALCVGLVRGARYLTPNQRALIEDWLADYLR